ncbi:MAG TPA: FixH family protein [Gemmatimonadales bacterium]|nr:FixH family protein [Gemmatimonadales bacterium]
MSPLLRKDRIWPTIVVLLLGGNLALGVVLIRVANADPHFAVEPDYYRRAVQWDSTLAQAARNAALGWQWTPSLGAVRGDSVPMMLAIAGPDGAPVDGAQVTIEARAVAHANETIVDTLSAQGGGWYGASLPIRRTGLWELRVRAVRGDEVATTDLRLEAHADAEATVVSARPGAADPTRLRAGTQPAP